MVVFNRRAPARGVAVAAVSLRAAVWAAASALLLAWCMAAAGAPASAAKPEVVIAAAANLTAAFQALGPRFEAETGIHPVFSFGATAQLARQIENGAPIDVFASADTAHVEELDAQRMLVPGSIATYAEGVLALWIPPQAGRASPIQRVEDLAAPAVRIVAVANPRLAPYGEAAVQSLKGAGVWERVKAKIVYAENINMARQYGASGNADAVFTAYPLVMKETGMVVKVPAALYSPIRQALGIVAGSKNPENARRFAGYLVRGNGRDLLKEFGYGVPAR